MHTTESGVGTFLETQGFQFWLSSVINFIVRTIFDKKKEDISGGWFVNVWVAQEFDQN